MARTDSGEISTNSTPTPTPGRQYRTSHLVRTLNSRLRQAELDVQNRAFREGTIRIDEHSVRADVGRPCNDILAVALVGDGKIAQV